MLALVRSFLLLAALAVMIACAIAGPALAQRAADRTGARMQFELPLLHTPERWASWCAPCIAEHPVITELSKRVAVVSIDYLDGREAGIAWLRRYGNPFRAALFDGDGRLGARGVPATFVIDKQGVARYRRVGPITPEIAAQQILPLLAGLERQ